MQHRFHALLPYTLRVLFFLQLKRVIKVTHYISEEEVNAAVKFLIREKSKEFFNDRINKLLLVYFGDQKKNINLVFCP